MCGRLWAGYSSGSLQSPHVHPRLVANLTVHWNRPRVMTVRGPLLLVFVLATACTTSHSSGKQHLSNNSPTAQADSSASNTPTGTSAQGSATAAPTNPITARQAVVATATARHELAVDAKVTRSVFEATATLGSDEHLGSDTNTGYRCPAGPVLVIKIYGSFNISHGGAAGPPTSAAASSPPDGVGYQAVVIYANRDTGKPCVLAWEPGPITPLPSETVLFAE
ncbi:MAG: hypothetical protein JWQ77_1003 [Jatrophihabitans sp.]|nr:hypothetical protein [Jatrophihabitans sp.]